MRYALDAFGLIGHCFDPAAHIDLLDLNIALDRNFAPVAARARSETA